MISLKKYEGALYLENDLINFSSFDNRNVQMKIVWKVLCYQKYLSSVVINLYNSSSYTKYTNHCPCYGRIIFSSYVEFCPVWVWKSKMTFYATFV